LGVKNSGRTGFSGEAGRRRGVIPPITLKNLLISNRDQATRARVKINQNARVSRSFKRDFMGAVIFEVTGFPVTPQACQDACGWGNGKKGPIGWQRSLSLFLDTKLHPRRPAGKDNGRRFNQGIQRKG
jgi:hypothetical protein